MCTLKTLIEREIPFAVILSDNLFRQRDNYLIALSQDVKEIKMESTVDKGEYIRVFSNSLKPYLGETDLTTADEVLFKSSLNLFTKIDLNGKGYAYEFTGRNFKGYYNSWVPILKAKDREKVNANLDIQRVKRSFGGRQAGSEFPNGYAKHLQK